MMLVCSSFAGLGAAGRNHWIGLHFIKPNKRRDGEFKWLLYTPVSEHTNLSRGL